MPKYDRALIKISANSRNNGPLRRLCMAATLFIIRGYQVIVSPLLGPCCRFYPSCSEYALQAIGRHGIWKGAYLVSRRLLKCHPFHPGGFDPVP